MSSIFSKSSPSLLFFGACAYPVLILTLKGGDYMAEETDYRKDYWTICVQMYAKHHSITNDQAAMELCRRIQDEFISSPSTQKYWARRKLLSLYFPKIFGERPYRL